MVQVSQPGRIMPFSSSASAQPCRLVPMPTFLPLPFPPLTGYEESDQAGSRGKETEMFLLKTGCLTKFWQNKYRNKIDGYFPPACLILILSGVASG